MRKPTPGARDATLLVLFAIAAPALGSTQQAQSVPKFDLVSSPIALTGDVRPHQYVGVLGRSAAWLGRETGEAELWVHPIKLAENFRLDFAIPDYVEPVRGSDIARTVAVHPHRTTVTYSHATFTVRQHIFVPLDRPGLIVLLDVSTLRPLDIIVSFKTVFQYAWPGAFGGQYSFWDREARAFVLSESLRQRNAMIGSPWATEASSHPAHSIPDAPNTFSIPIDTSRTKHEFVPIVVAAATAPRDSVRVLYDQLMRDAERLYRQRVIHTDSLLTQTTSIDSPDDDLDLAFTWSKVNLDEALVCNPDLGCGLVAGWGPSGNGTRPGFGWFFGGDAAINSFAMDAVGLWPQVKSGLEFLANYQREDGKIPHEISQAAGRIPWFTDFPYTYYHADTTPFWIVALWQYWRASGDEELLDELWEPLERAYAWCLSRDTDGDGLIENGPGNLGAIEIGQLGEGMHQDIYLAAVWVQALKAIVELAGTRGATELAGGAQTILAKANSRLNEGYWRAEDGHHAFGILASGGTNDNLTVWPATAASFSLLEPSRAERTLIKLATDSISTDWGARILSSGSPLYDPMHYNNGAVWPFLTGFVAWGQYNYRRPWAGFPLIDALKQSTFVWARGRHPELISGRFYRPLDTAVPQQFFATSMLVSPILYGLVGWEPDAPNSRARLAPRLPPSWASFSVDDLRIADTRVAALVEQGPGRMTVELTSAGGPVDMEVSLPVPPGARQVQLSAAPVEGMGGGSFVPGRKGGEYSIHVMLEDSPIRISLEWTGGLSLDPPTVGLQPGQSSGGLRVLDFGFEDDTWKILVEGEAGGTYKLRAYGERVRVIDGPATAESESGRNTLQISFPGGEGRLTVPIGLEPTPP